MTSASEADARFTSFSVIPPTPVWMTLTRTSACWIFWISPRSASTEPWTSPFKTMLRSCTSPAWRSSCSVSSETRRRGRCASCSRRSRSARTFARCFAWRSCSTTRTNSPAIGRMLEAEHLDRLARPCFLHLLAAIVVERAHLPGRVPCDRGVADLQRPALDEHRRRPARDRRRAATRSRRPRHPRRVRAQVELGVRDEQDLLEQVVEVLLLLARRPARTASSRPSPPAAGLRRRARS